MGQWALTRPMALGTLLRHTMYPTSPYLIGSRLFMNRVAKGMRCYIVQREPTSRKLIGPRVFTERVVAGVSAVNTRGPIRRQMKSRDKQISPP